MLSQEVMENHGRIWQEIYMVQRLIELAKANENENLLVVAKPNGGCLVTSELVHKMCESVLTGLESEYSASIAKMNEHSNLKF